MDVDVVKSERQQALEAREGALTPQERQELDNLQATYAARLADLAADEPDHQRNEHGEYLPHTIDYGYHPRPMSAEAQAAFAATRRKAKPTFWRRIKARFGR